MSDLRRKLAYLDELGNPVFQNPATLLASLGLGSAAEHAASDFATVGTDGTVGGPEGTPLSSAAVAAAMPSTALTDSSGTSPAAGKVPQYTGTGHQTVPISLPASLNYLGAWSPATNTPTLADGTETDGTFYQASAAGTQNLGSGSQTFAIGDYVLHESGVWTRVPGSINLLPFDKDNGQTGILTPQIGYPAPAALLAVVYLSRFRPSRNMLLTKVAFGVETAATANDSCDIGIYDGQTSPLSLIGHTGATTGKLGSTGVQTIPFTSPIQLTAGHIYYAAFDYVAINGTAATVQRMQTTGELATAEQLFGSAPPQVEMGYTAPAASLPSTITSFAGATASAPLLALRES